MTWLKVKAGALQLTIFIVVVIALLLTSFIILIHTHKRFKLQTDFVKETIANTEIGIDYVLQNDILQNDTISIDLKDDDYKTVKVYSDYWGVFEKVISISKIKHNSFKKIALVGASQLKTNRTALYVKDNNKPLVVVGNTKIQGTTYLPKQGIRTGNISGHSYYGNQLIYGISKMSKPELPKLLNETLEHIKTVQNTSARVSQEQFIDLSKTRTYQNSFYKPLQVVYSPTDILLYGVSLTGHILVQSKTKISVDASSNLKDVILIAPTIEVKDYVKGTFQCLATENINIGKYCELNYPSALVLNEEPSPFAQGSKPNKEDKQSGIKIEKESTIKGVIVYLGDTKNYKAQVYIGENVTITGEVYCNQNLELLGTVNGSVFTSNFVANQSGSSYQNHLYNATISIDDLSEEYVGLPFENSKKGVIKWLY